MKRLDALLINPPTPLSMGNKEFLFPPSLMSLAGYAEKHGFVSSLLDLNIFLCDDDERDPDYPERYLTIVCERIHLAIPRVVGVGCLFSGQFPFVNAVSQRIKAFWPDIIICVGGIHPTIFAQEILQNCPAIEYVCIGEGEEQYVEILKRAQNPEISICCEGIGFRRNREVVIREKTQFICDLDSLPMPAYSLVNFDDYRHDLSKWHNPKGHKFDISVPLITSRSCPNRCNFCSMFLVMGPRFRARSAIKVVDEMEYLYLEHGVRHYSIMDDNLTFSKTRTLAICDEICKRGLDIQFDTPNGLMVRTLDEEVIGALADAGWVRGSIAIESGSNYIRNKIVGKGLKEETIYRVLDWVEKYPHIFIRAYFIMGFPEDTCETLDATYQMIERLKLDDVYVNNLLPFPGTKLFNQCVNDNLLIDFSADNIWQADCLFTTGNSRFFIKPYNLSLEKLEEYRVRFDELCARQRLIAKKRKKALFEKAKANVCEIIRPREKSVDSTESHSTRRKFAKKH